jgi:hypothetical protein
MHNGTIMLMLMLMASFTNGSDKHSMIHKRMIVSGNNSHKSKRYSSTVRLVLKVY